MNIFFIRFIPHIFSNKMQNFEINSDNKLHYLSQYFYANNYNFADKIQKKITISSMSTLDSLQAS